MQLGIDSGQKVFRAFWMLRALRIRCGAVSDICEFQVELRMKMQNKIVACICVLLGFVALELLLSTVLAGLGSVLSDDVLAVGVTERWFGIWLCVCILCGVCLMKQSSFRRA